MKQKDIILVIVAVFVGIVISVVLSKTFITAPKNRQQQVEVVDPISADFPALDTKYFNGKSVDPTQLIKIGNNANTKPFNTKSQ